jgi:hypothetical protein
MMPRRDSFAKPRQKRAAHNCAVNPRYASTNGHEQRILAPPPSSPTRKRGLVTRGLSGNAAEYRASGTQEFCFGCFNAHFHGVRWPSCSLGENPPALVTQAGLSAAATTIDTKKKTHVTRTREKIKTAHPSTDGRNRLLYP